MVLEFRTKRDINGNCKYLAIDTDKKEYSRTPHGWIFKDIPQVRVCDIRLMEEKAKQDGFKEIETL